MKMDISRRADKIRDEMEEFNLVFESHVNREGIAIMNLLQDLNGIALLSTVLRLNGSDVEAEIIDEFIESLRDYLEARHLVKVDELSLIKFVNLLSKLSLDSVEYAEEKTSTILFTDR